MKKVHLLFALALVAGCSDASQAPLAPADAPSRTLWSVDNDGDGIDDGLEWELATRHAPVLYMPNLITREQAKLQFPIGDWTWPATVDWYLSKIAMQFHHDDCPDGDILPVGWVNSANLVTQRHQRAVSYYGCSHSGDWYSSGGGWSYENHFFLTSDDEYQANYDDVVHPGVRDPGQWQTYFRVYRNNFGGYNIQYWFFYAYNDFISYGNHEGDWEHINVRLGPQGEVLNIWLAQHKDLKLYSPGSFTWYGGTHPEIWVADGSHASYLSEGQCDGSQTEGYVYGDCWTNPDQRWFTWSGGRGADRGIQGAGLVNMGEKPNGGTHRPMPGQDWVKYSGRWGEIGDNPLTNSTDGPRGPAYQPNWTKDAYVQSGTATSGECENTTLQPTQIRPAC